ncbi:MAG: hypothetical protein K2O91_16000 [Lachnospiraceae bacterium]|nr:hypothetical protein [Lachnospiraceae bacterium]
MDKKSVLYQLMGMRMNSIVNGITEQEEDYQALLQEVDKYSDMLEALHLPAEAMKLLDRYVSEYNAIGSHYGMLAYMLGFSDCRELLLDPAHPGKEALADGLL